MPWTPAPFHPLACARWSVWRDLLLRYGPVSGRAWQAMLTTSAATVMWSFGKRAEQKRLREAIQPDPPIFIVGHWRSGTTLLHNLIHHTGGFATLRTIDALNPLGENPPDGALSRSLKRKDRGFDKVAFGPEEPQEEEMALAALGLISVFHLVYFPQSAHEIYRRAVMLEGLEPGELEAFAEAYQLVTAKTRLVDGTKRPILFKNPASTARIPFLKRVFPGARFIHVVRHPRSVYHSMELLVRGLAERFSLQSLDGVDLHDHHFHHYRMLMQGHLEQRRHLEPGHYAEIRYEDLVANPMAGVEKVVGEIGLTLADEQRMKLSEYTESLSGYKPNRHPDDPGTDALLKRELAFAYDTWGYD